MDQIRRALDKARNERSFASMGTAADGDVAAVRVGTAWRADRASAPEAAALAEPRIPPVETDLAHWERQRLLMPGAAGAGAGAFRLLRTQVLTRMAERGWRSIGVTSARSGDGRSTVAANLALSIASDPGQEPLLVDLDWRRPGLASLFGLTPAATVEDVLEQRTTLGAAAVRPQPAERLRILAARGGSPADAAGEGIARMIAAERDREAGSIVVVDLPAALDADESVSLAARVDCVLLVVAEGRSAREDVARALTLLRAIPVVGTVLNRAQGDGERGA
ncbi:MAG: CpsD/CapB family tyrosine-protein kinase [Proteobacteria bacterium]|nr:CpsD/CapB family tyrosine-protein kinase [Pseudomonadota bacterium]